MEASHLNDEIKSALENSKIPNLSQDIVNRWHKYIVRLCGATKYRLGSYMRHHYNNLFDKSSDKSSSQENRGLLDDDKSVPDPFPDPSKIKNFLSEINMLSKPHSETWWILFFYIFGRSHPTNSCNRKEILEVKKQFWAQIFKGTEQHFVELCSKPSSKLGSNSNDTPRGKEGMKTIRSQFISYAYQCYKEHRDSTEEFLFPLHAMLAFHDKDREQLRIRACWSVAGSKNLSVLSGGDNNDDNNSTNINQDQDDEDDNLPVGAWDGIFSHSKVTLSPSSFSDPIPPVPFYAIDMHTSEGVRKGRNHKDFVLEGSLVIPENLEYHQRDWKDNYILDKIKQGEAKSAGRKNKYKMKNGTGKATKSTKRKFCDEPTQEINDHGKYECKDKSTEDKSTGLHSKKLLTRKGSSKNKIYPSECPLSFTTDGILPQSILDHWKENHKSLYLFQRVTSSKTSSYKQITLLDRMSGRVFKGPFCLNQANTPRRLESFKRRYDFFQSLGMIQTPRASCFLEENNPSNVSIEFENLITIPRESYETELKFETEDGRVEEMNNGWFGRVLNRNSTGVVCFIDAIKDSRDPCPNKCVIEAVFYLFVRAVMNPPLEIVDFGIYCIDMGIIRFGWLISRKKVIALNSIAKRNSLWKIGHIA